MKKSPDEMKKTDLHFADTWTRTDLVVNTPTIYSQTKEATWNAFNRKLFLSQKQQTPKKVSKSKFAYDCVKGYCDNTSLHGFKYITEDSNLRFERVLWILFCSGAIIGTAFYLRPVFERYMDTPIATTIASVSEPIWSVPFPGVTICNVNKALKTVAVALQQHSSLKEYSSKTMESIVQYMARTGRVQTNDTIADEVTVEFQELMERLKGKSLSAVMKIVMQPIERMAVKCWWISKPVNCSQIFEPRQTDAGFCWGFNSADFGKRVIPRKVNGAGPNVGLVVLLNPEVEEYYAYSHNMYGFRVRIHHPQKFSFAATKSFLVEAGKEMYVAVTPTATTSTPRIRDTPVSKRACRYESERSLKYFPVYSYENCRLECALSSMNDTCGCVPYMYYLLPNQTNCNYTGTQCINKHTTKFLTVAPKQAVKGLVNITSMEKCDCPPSCEVFMYSQEISEATFPKYPNDLKYVPEGIDRSKLVLLRVFFKKETFVKYQRDVTFSGNDFIAAFGGIVSLFIGFSFVSALELIYFFTIRPMFRWKRSKTENVSQGTPFRHQILR